MEYNFFETIVAGDNPKDIMSQYDNKKSVEPYIVYKRRDADYIKCKYLESYQSALGLKSLSEHEKDEIRKNIHRALLMPAEAFFDEFTEDYERDEEGNAISTDNPNGKWSFYQRGKLFSVPFITLDGREVFQARKGDIDWNIMHLHGQEIYRRAWEMVMEGSKPQNGHEENIFNNMKNRTTYFSNFESKEAYVIHSTAFWGYAFASEETGWKELEEGMNQFDWVANFYERFIEPLPDDTILTIFECKK